MEVIESSYGINEHECEAEEKMHDTSMEKDTNGDIEYDENACGQERNGILEDVERQEDKNEDYLEWREADDQEREAVEEFVRAGCGCRWNCSSKFDAEHFTEMRDQCYELTHDELDLFLMGQIMASTVKKERNSSHFYHLGEKVKKKRTK